MRVWLWTVPLLLDLAAPAAQAQAAPNPDAFRNGIQYSFERAWATRRVHDAFDHGRISLAVYIWRPLKDSRHEVVLFSHGSLGGITIDPHEPVPYIPPELLQFLVKRGYTVVVPTRRGIGESTGTFREECAFAAGKCTLEEYRALTETGLNEAVADMNAVIDQVIEGHEVPKATKILLAGISRGGFLALRLAAEHPDLTLGVINFVGGWLSIADTWPPEENALRLEMQHNAFADFGARTHGTPTLWIYAVRDPFFSEATSRGFFAAFREGGSVGDYLFVTDHKLRSGHIVGTDPSLWSKNIEEFLAARHPAASGTAKDAHQLHGHIPTHGVAAGGSVAGAHDLHD